MSIDKKFKKLDDIDHVIFHHRENDFDWVSAFGVEYNQQIFIDDIKEKQIELIKRKLK